MPSCRSQLEEGASRIERASQTEGAGRAKGPASGGPFMAIIGSPRREGGWLYRGNDKSKDIVGC